MRGTATSDSSRPYPWGSLEHWTRRDVVAGRLARSVLTSLGEREELERILGDEMGEPHALSLGPFRPLEEAHVGDEGFSVSFVHEGVAIGLIVEPALGDRSIRSAFARKRSGIVGPLTGHERSSPSAFAGVLAHLGRLSLRSSLRVVHASAVSRSPSVASWLISAFGESSPFEGGVAADLRVAVPGARFRGTILLPGTFPATAASFRLMDLGDLPLRLSVVRESVALTEDEMAELATGDVLVLQGVSRKHASDTVVLVARGGTKGQQGTLRGGREIVLASPSMGGSTIEETLSEAPVVVRVEIGSVELTAAEWATLGAGDVVSLERPIGSKVVLSVGSRAVAEGELVDVDGQIGVRILRRGA